MPIGGINRTGSGTFSTGRTADSFLAWRSGSVVGVVFIEGRSFATSDQIATELAHRQQAHIEHPTLYTRVVRSLQLRPEPDY